MRLLARRVGLAGHVPVERGADVSFSEGEGPEIWAREKSHE